MGMDKVSVPMHGCWSNCLTFDWHCQALELVGERLMARITVDICDLCKTEFRSDKKPRTEADGVGPVKFDVSGVPRSQFHDETFDVLQYEHLCRKCADAFMDAINKVEDEIEESVHGEKN